MAHSSFAFVLIASLAGPSALLAQETAPETAAPDAAATTPAQVAPADCATDFGVLDTDGNGVLSPTEAPRDTARAAVDGIAPGTDGLTKDQFTQICASETWAQMTPEEGAPFDGANSFTEEQARERATAWNVTEVSPLTLDDQGIWRGTGKVAEAAVNVAVDYKGNVVTTPTTN
jgi:hypothetical protein